MNNWVGELRQFNEPVVLVTVASVRGSAPRETGAKMIVSATESIGTIGGGQLEYQSMQIAYEQLTTPSGNVNSRRFALGANCGQCCGGVVDVMFELLPAAKADWLVALGKFSAECVAAVIATPVSDPRSKTLLTAEGCESFGDGAACPGEVRIAARAMLSNDEPAQVVAGYLLEPVRPTTFNIAVFGAGHVGAATIDVLSRLDCDIRWIDSRRNLFPASLPENVSAIATDDVAPEVRAMPGHSFYLIMTHSHAIDQEICAQVLSRTDFAYCGLIGSQSKRRRFERRLRATGLTQAQFDRLVCPIGVRGVSGRKPVDIAISVAAELLQVRGAVSSDMRRRAGREKSVRAI